MKALTIATFALAVAFAGPVAAGIGGVDLPHLTFPKPVVTPSTKGCETATTAGVCQPGK